MGAIGYKNKNKILQIKSQKHYCCCCWLLLNWINVHNTEAPMKLSRHF